MTEPAYNLEILEERARQERLLFHQARLCARTVVLTARHARKKIEDDPERGMKALERYVPQLSRTIESLEILLDKINSV